jgi:uncharacterized protein YbaP (TraB family)
MSIKKAVSAIVFVVFFSIFSIAQSKYPSILWEIKKTKDSKPSYLFGTYHVSSKGVFKLGDSIFVAIKNVDIVAKEVNANTWQKDRNDYDVMAKAYTSYRNQLRPRIFSENTLKKTNTIEKLTQFMGLSFDYANYFLYRNNAQNEGFEEEMYLDKFISSMGYKYGKEVKGLENYMESNVLGIEGMKDQADLEKVEKKKLPLGISYREMEDKIYDGYLNNNLDAMDSFSVYQFESDAYANKFLIQRNYNQADSIDYYIKTGKTIFAAVGSAHLPGSKGVIEILRKKGYELRPVKLAYKDNTALEEVKKMQVPIKLSTQSIDDVINVSGPGEFFAYDETDILKTYGYVDMANGAYYFIARLYNNAVYFNGNESNIASAIDSLLYGSIKGDIIEKKQIDFKGYKCIDVLTKVKNKDFERYRFVITPYEIIKFQVAGKNDYVKTSSVDKFFTEITINDTKKINNNASFNFKQETNFHQWKAYNEGYFAGKERYTNYDKQFGQLNSCIKILLPVGAKLNDSLLMHMVRESLASSEIFARDFINEKNNIPLEFNKTNIVKLKNDASLLYKFVLNYPYLYMLTSLNKTTIDEGFVKSFFLKPYVNNTNYAYVDSAKGYSVKIPFELSFDNKWKLQADRIKKKYDDNKNPNDNKNLFYYGSLFGNNSYTEPLVFEDKANMEVIKMVYNLFDNESYYHSTNAFWKNYMKKYASTNSGRRESNDEDVVTTISSYSLGNSSNTISNKMGSSILNEVYDTASNTLQKVSFVMYDSSSERKTFHQVILAANKLYDISFVQHQKEFTETQQLFLKSFQSIETAKPISIYSSKMDEIIADYEAATKQKRPNILSRLNNINVGISDFAKLKTVYAGLNKNAVEQNILKRKLVDMVASGNYSDKEWPTISKWLFQIFNDKKTPMTIRNFAVYSIIKNEKLSDADSIIKYFYAKPNPFQKRFSTNVLSYFKNVYPKENLFSKVGLSLKEKDDYKFIRLVDSGYFNTSQKLMAFNYYKKMLEDETMNMQLSQEKNDFQFKEKEINETLSSSNEKNKFQLLLNGFELYYKLKPTDIFFKDATEQIIASKSNEDLIGLMSILLKQKETDFATVNRILDILKDEPSKLYDINKIFYENKKYDKLPVSFKDKIKIAKCLLLKERQYNKLDSISFVDAQKYPYSANDSFYIFKYVKNRETNANIAFVILDKDNSFYTNTPYQEFTSEQITAIDTYEKVIPKLMRKYFTSTYFVGRNNFYSNYNLTKSIASDE